MLIVKLFRQHSKGNFSTLKGHLWSTNASWWSVLPLLPAVCNLAVHVPVCTVPWRLYTPLLSGDVNAGTWMCLEIPKEIITKGRQGHRGDMRKCQEHRWGPASLVFLLLLTHPGILLPQDAVSAPSLCWECLIPTFPHGWLCYILQVFAHIAWPTNLQHPYSIPGTSEPLPCFSLLSILNITYFLFVCLLLLD